MATFKVQLSMGKLDGEVHWSTKVYGDYIMVINIYIYIISQVVILNIYSWSGSSRGKMIHGTRESCSMEPFCGTILWNHFVEPFWNYEVKWPKKKKRMQLNWLRILSVEKYVESQFFL